MPRQEANSVETQFKRAGIDTTKIVESNTKPKTIYHYKVNSSLVVIFIFLIKTGLLLLFLKFNKSNSEMQIVNNEEINNSSNTFMPNMLNPYLYEDYRMYREKYTNQDHGCTPNVLGKRYFILFAFITIIKHINIFFRPFRGDFSIHPDWPPRLKHHRLPYIY